MVNPAQWVLTDFHSQLGIGHLRILLYIFGFMRLIYYVHYTLAWSSHGTVTPSQSCLPGQSD